MPSKSKDNHYVDNEKFYEEIVKYKAALKHARDNNLEKPVMPNYLGSCFHKIAEKLSNGWQFQRYIYREDMVSNAVYYCVKYIDTFDPERTKNPFAYFTQACYYAFIGEIKKEKKNLAVKYKAIINTELSHSASERHAYDESAATDSADKIAYSDHARDKMYEYIEAYDTGLKKKKEKAAKK